jgi:hypothetical protein
MTILTNTLTRYSLDKSIREDFADMIYDISPDETPVMSAFGRGKAQSTFTEWQTDALAAAVTTNAQLDGDDIVSVTDSRAATQKVGNYLQISRKIITVSGSAQAVNNAGMRSKQAYELAKAGSELKTDIESSILAVSTAVAGNTTVARVSASLPNWIITNWTAGTTTAAARPQMSSGAASTDLDGTVSVAGAAGTTVTFTETILKSMMSQLYRTGGKAKTLWVGPFNKGVVSTFSGIATRYLESKATQQAAIVGAADVYQGDFGRVTVVPDLFTTESIVILGDPQYGEVAWLRPIQTLDMAKTGDSTKKLIIGEWTLKVKAQKSFAAKWAASTS